MQYQFNERTENIKTILFRNSSPLHVSLIRYFKEEGVTGTFTKKEFRYSFDNATWTNWNTLTQGNLSAIQFRDNPDFYLEVQYTREGIGSGNILRWYLFYDSAIPTPPSPPEASINADYLQGEPGSYYLNRENFYGPYEDLIISNVPDGSAIGVYSHRVDSSEGTEFFFKRVEGAGSIIITESSLGIITIDSSGGGSGAGELYYNPNPVLATVGGITIGTSFFDPSKGFAETMQAIFYPTVYPTFTNPSVSFSVSPVASLRKIGDSPILQFTSALSRGSINYSWQPNDFRSGPGWGVRYTGTGLIDNPSSPSSPNIQTLNPYIVLQGVQSWTSTWDVSQGPQPVDSQGDPYSTPYPAGPVGPGSVSFEGVYPLYATTVSIGTLTEQSLVSMINGNNIQFNLVAQPPFSPDKQSFDIPDLWLASRPLQGVETYNALTTSWEYEGGSAFSSLTYWNTSSTTHVINGLVNYTRYAYNDDDRGATQIRLKF